MNEKKIGCVQHDCQECKDRERQSVPAGLQNIDRSVIEQALEWVEAQPEPRMLGAAKIITSLREALAAPQPQPVQEPVAWSVFDNRTGRHWYTHESKYTAQHYANEYSHRESDGTDSMVVQPLYTSPQAAQPLREEPSPIFVLLAVEESIKNGECPWQIEQAFDEYEAHRQSAITKGTT